MKLLVLSLKLLRLAASLWSYSVKSFFVCVIRHVLNPNFIWNYNESFWAETICHGSYLHLKSPVAEDTLLPVRKETEISESGTEDAIITNW